MNFEDKIQIKSSTGSGFAIAGVSLGLYSVSITPYVGEVFVVMGLLGGSVYGF